MNRIAIWAAAAALITAVGCSSMTGRTAGRNIDDAAITAAVKTELATEKAKTLTSVDVDTINGTVYLTGVVSDGHTKRRAAELAGRVDGVEHVVNNLQTRSTRSGDAPDY